MDRFTRYYAAGLGLVVVLLLGLWLVSFWQPKVWALNDRLKEDEMLASYPYPFRVRAVEGETAVISSPRSFEVPVIRFVTVIQPELAGKPQDDPAVAAAQARLIAHQSHARKLVLADPNIEGVRWELDLDWYQRQGINPRVP